MFLTKDERAIVLLWRIEDIRSKTFLGYYKNYSVGENKVRKLKTKLEKMGYNPDAKLEIN